MGGYPSSGSSSNPSSSASSSLTQGGDTYGALPGPAAPPGAYGETASGGTNWTLIAIIGGAVVAVIALVMLLKK